MTRLGSEPSPLDPKPYALAIRLPRLLHGIFCFYKDEYVILSFFSFPIFPFDIGLLL